MPVRPTRALHRHGAFALLPLLLAAGGLTAYRADGPVRPEAAGKAPVLYVPAPPERCEGLGAALPRRLRVLVWNVYKGARPGWADAFAGLAADRDLVLLQEAWLREDAASPMGEALAARRLAWQVVVSWVDEAGQGPSTGVATGASARPLTVTPLVSPATEPVLGTPKTALATTYRLAGDERTLLVVNVHALNVVAAETLQLQLDQLEARLRDHRGPCLLAGDFNVWTDDKQGRLRALATRQGLAEVRFDGLAEDADARTRVFGNALDYAFCRGLAVERASVHVTERSDHNALLLDVTY